MFAHLNQNPTDNLQKCKCFRCMKESSMSENNRVCSHCGSELIPPLSSILPHFANPNSNQPIYLPPINIPNTPYPTNQNNFTTQLPSLSSPNLTRNLQPNSPLSSQSLPHLPTLLSPPEVRNPPQPTLPSIRLEPNSETNSNVSRSPLPTPATPPNQTQTQLNIQNMPDNPQAVQRVLQTIHLQHIQHLIEIQRSMHATNPPYPLNTQPNEIARIVNEINNLMHNHSLRHFQTLSSTLQNSQNTSVYESVYNDDMEDREAHSEYNRILAELFERQQGHYGPPPTDKSEILKLPQILFSEEDLKEEKNCAVCKEAFQEDDTALELPCNHPFHQDCILPWLKNRNTCPCCRFQLKAEENPQRDTAMSDSEYDMIDSDSDFSSDDGDDSSNSFTTSYVYNNQS